MSLSLSQLVDSLAARLRREEGQTMAEYALLLGLILVVTAVVVAALGTQIKGVFTSVTSAL
ncbi:MAG TPA: Flp family type IVb pilin [Solirubrobacteraceae bacterium]|nr:Flp family type IVb pilin [Solirubrobacteraceae bacterium]